MAAFTRISSAIAALVISGAVQAAPVAGCDFETGRQYQKRQDYPRAKACFEESAANGSGDAYFQLGNMAISGWGEAKDPARAKSLYEQAAGRGVAAAMHNLAVIGEHGLAGPADLRAAMAWYRKAAELRWPEAQTALGVHYISGKVERNLEEGERLLTLAANAGDVRAQFNLGMLYFNGYKEQTHLGQAVIWMERASLGGNATAPQAVGAIYADGRGVKADLQRAYQWFLISEHVGSPDAKKAQASVQGGLSEAQRATARQQMQAWLAAQQLLMAQRNGPLPSAANPLQSRCAVMALKAAPAMQAGADGATQFGRLIAGSNEHISKALASQMTGYRMIFVQIGAADTASAGTRMARHMREHDCAQGIELTHEFGKAPGGGYVQYTLSVYKLAAQGDSLGARIHAMPYRMSMDDAFKADFNAVAAMFLADLNGASILSGISI